MGTALLCLSSGLATPAAGTAAVTTLCAVWWVTLAIPIPATSLIPFAVLPLLGILDRKEVATAYGHPMIMLLLGGFLLSTAMERSGAHRRLALGMVRAVGGDGGRRLVLGFMIACALLSMWISNTATTLMLLPIAIAVLDQDETGELATPLLLGIAYSASIGGLGTPVGTPPNVIFLGAYQELTGNDMSFAHWMTIAVPIVVLMIPLTWAWLTRNLSSQHQLQLPQVGAWRSAEKRVLGVFTLTAIAWVTRREPFGGWSGALDLPGVGDGTVAFAAVIAMFLIPDGNKQGERLLDWETANRIPWGLLILFAGGIALAKAFGASGLSAALGSALSALASWPTLLMLVALCLAVTFLTELTSNTATSSLLMPILAAASIAAGLEPATLMVPAALSASCAFMLPVATAPNAIVFGTDRLPIQQMVRHGIVVNLLGVVIISAVCFARL